MPGSGPSGVGNSTSLTVVYSETLVSVSGSSNSPLPPSSTLFLSSSLSSSTSNSATAVNTPNRLLTTSQSSQTATSTASSLSTSSAGHVDPSSISSSTASATTTFSTMTKGLDASHVVGSSDGSSPVVYTEAISSIFPPTTTSSSMPPDAYDSLTSFGRTSSTLATQSGYINIVSSASSSTYSPAPVPAALDASTTWAASFASYQDHATTSNSAPEPTSTRVPTSTLTSVSSIVSKATTGTESASTYAHTVVWPPQQIVSSMFTIITQTTKSGSTLLTTITSGVLVPIPTTSSNVSPNSSSTSKSLLPLILGPVLGVLVIVALGITVFRCRARRRSENMSYALPGDSETWREQKDWTIIEETPRVNAVTLGRGITSYRGSSTYTPEHITTCISHAGESSQNSNRQDSDPFADSLDIVSSRTSIHSVDSVSTNMAFTVSVNAEAQDVGEFGSSMDASTSSLELHFVAPLVTIDDSSTLSPSWHYDGQSPTSSPREGGCWNEEQQGETSPVSLRASPPKPFPLGTESARLRLHALLREAGSI